jgi:hypothetical protein
VAFWLGDQDDILPRPPHGLAAIFPFIWLAICLFSGTPANLPTIPLVADVGGLLWLVSDHADRPSLHALGRDSGSCATLVHMERRVFRQVLTASTHETHACVIKYCGPPGLFDASTPAIAHGSDIPGGLFSFFAATSASNLHLLDPPRAGCNRECLPLCLWRVFCCADDTMSPMNFLRSACNAMAPPPIIISLALAVYLAAYVRPR